ncbi:MAG: ABC transporter ATP-binding protein/permease, partial [Deferribacteraceae bacterium]|nr:ABC transporter ATP-binding protein/permease [Deferribacteraceae bacterium]
LAAVLYYFVYRNEYRKTFTTAYSESAKIRLEVAERVRKLPLSFFNNKDLTELTTNIMADCTSIEHTMSHVVPEFFAALISVVIASLLLAFYDWRLCLALFAAMPISIGLIFLSRNIQKLLGERHVQAKLAVSEKVQEYLEGIKVIKAFSMAGERYADLDRSLKAMMKQAIKYEGATSIFVVLASMILQVGIALVVLTGVLLVTNGEAGPVKFLVFLVISVKIYAPLLIALTLLPEFFYMLVSTRRMQELRKEPLMQGDKDIELKSFDIALKDVFFAYNQNDVIKGVNIEFLQNKVTALVGPSGSGKSTIARLIARFWDVKSGDITISGINIRTFNPEKLMQYMSFVFQDVVLFNDTVLNNIRIGRQDATDEEIFNAARSARCDDFIKDMPDGYNTLIGENGSTLSGGERQRISIARALLKDAPIVLLDEATASLDPENETLVQEAISELIHDKTVIVIAHRLRTVLAADKIIVLDNGEVVGEGTGDELLAKVGLFARLYSIQKESANWTAGRL